VSAREILNHADGSMLRVNSKSKFNTTMRSLFPLPDLNADPRSPTHPNAYEDFPPGTRVLAIYPDTSSFYRGIVRHPPVPGTASGHPVPKATSGSIPGKYIVEFDDDNNQQQLVNWDLVFEASLLLDVEIAIAKV
jgi:SAGA-associated factor 29